MHITAAIAVILLLANNAFAFVVTTNFDLTGNANLFPDELEHVTPLAVSLFVNSTAEPVILEFRTEGTFGDAPVPVFISLLNNAAPLWEAMQLEVGSVLDGVFAASGQVVQTVPLGLSLSVSTRRTSVEPGMWLFDRFTSPWETGDPGSFTMFVAVPANSLAFRFTPTVVPEPAGAAVWIIAAALWSPRRASRHRA